MNKEELNKKREKEKEIVIKMINIYYRNKGQLSEDKKELIEYVKEKIDKCPCMENKTFCSSCKVHCYDNVHRNKIKEVMRKSGPKMLLYHPILSIKHGIDTIKNKKE